MESYNQIKKQVRLMCSVNKAYFSLFLILIHTFSSNKLFCLLLFLKYSWSLVYCPTRVFSLIYILLAEAGLKVQRVSVHG